MPKLGMVIDGFYGLVEVFPEATMWMDSLKIKRASYHGAQFEGRECDVLLENIDGLQNIVANSNFTPCVTRSSTAQALQHPAEPFIKLFQSLKNLKEKVFGYQSKEGWEESIKLFIDAHKASGNENKHPCHMNFHPCRLSYGPRY